MGDVVIATFSGFLRTVVHLASRIPGVGFLLRTTGLYHEDASSLVRGEKRTREENPEEDGEALKKCKRDVMFDSIRDFIAGMWGASGAGKTPSTTNEEDSDIDVSSTSKENRVDKTTELENLASAEEKGSDTRIKEEAIERIVPITDGDSGSPVKSDEEDAK